MSNSQTTKSSQPPPPGGVGSSSTSTGDFRDGASPVAVTDDRTLVSEYCRKLDVSATVEQNALYLFEKVKMKNNNERHAIRENQYYALCSIFMSSRIHYRSSAATETTQDVLPESVDLLQNIEQLNLSIDGITVDQIRSVDQSIELVEFMEMLNSMIALFKFESFDLFTQLKIVQKKLIILDCVYKEFSDYFMNHYVEGDDHLNLKQFCWMFYLLLAYEPEVKATDFESMYQLLQATLSYMWENVPQDLKILSADSVPITKLFGIKSTGVPSYLKSVPERLMNQLVSSNQLTNEPVGSMFSHLSELETVFEDKYAKEANSVDFDARLFFQQQYSNHKMIGSSKLLLSAPVYQLNPQKIRDFVEQNPELRSPLRSPRTTYYQPKSVMHATLQSIQLLSIKVGSQSDLPDSELIQFFKACDTDQTEIIEKRLQKLIEVIQPAMQLNEYQQAIRTSMIKKIYYQVLKDMLIGEQARLQKNNFTALLSNEDFHKSHVVCSVETVLFAYNMKDTLEFENILGLIDLEPFGLSVVIESFVGHATWLNSTFRRHFRSVEETLLDSLVWVSPSFYEKIKQQEQQEKQAADGEQVAAGEEEQAPTTLHPGTVTPMAKKRQRVFNVYEHQNKAQHQKNSMAIKLFFRKVYQLVSQRIIDLCKEFNQKSESLNAISPEVMKQIWHVVWYVLNSRHSLMRNRHIDHMIMCAMYAVCNKVNKMNWISFKDTIQNYRTICETNRNISPVEAGKIFGQVLLDQGRTGDIVKFYNLIFIPEVKDFILQCSPKSGTWTSLPDMPQPTSTMQSPQRQRVSKNANVFISPLRSPRHKQQRGNHSVSGSSLDNPLLSPSIHMGGATISHIGMMTPRTRALYSFRDACTEKLIGLEPQPTSSVKRSLSFAGMEEGGAESSSSSSTTTATNDSEPPSKFRKTHNSRRAIDFDKVNEEQPTATHQQQPDQNE